MRPRADLFFGSMLGVHPSASAVGGRIFVRRPPGKDRPGDSPHGQWKLLWDFETLELLCLMEDSSLHPYMVGAHVGVGIKWLARPDAHALAILGSGEMARGCIRAIKAVRNIEDVRVYSPNPEHRRAFATDASETFGFPVAAVDSGEEAVREADIVLCATSTTTAVYSFDWLTPGTHVTSIGEREIDEASFLNGRIIPSTMEALPGRVPPSEPFQSLYDRGLIPPENLPGDLTQIITGQIVGRRGPEDITIAMSSAPGYQHAAAARWVYEEARKQSLGHEWAVEST
jgi:alanine dehydrogenase